MQQAEQTKAADEGYLAYDPVLFGMTEAEYHANRAADRARVANLPKLTPEEWNRRFEKFGETMRSIWAKYPNAPSLPEDFSREDIYSDHD